MTLPCEARSQWHCLSRTFEWILLLERRHFLSLKLITWATKQRFAPDPVALVRCLRGCRVLLPRPLKIQHPWHCTLPAETLWPSQDKLSLEEQITLLVIEIALLPKYFLRCKKRGSGQGCVKSFQQSGIRVNVCQIQCEQYCTSRRLKSALDNAYVWGYLAYTCDQGIAQQ